VANTIKHKRSSSTGETPDAADLSVGEIAVNTADGLLFTKHTDNAIVTLGASYAHPNHSGEVTSTGDGATVISDNVVDEANLKVSNSPTNGYFLSAQSGNSGGLTWATVPAGYNDADVASYLASASSVGFGGRITADAGIDIDNIIIDGSTITSNTHLNLDIVGDLRIDVDGAEVKLADGGVEFGQLYKNSNDFAIFSSVSDGNLLLQGNDGGSTITALTLDMSEAGSATFSGGVEVPNSGQFKAASSNATKYVRMYAGGGTGKSDI